MGKLVEDEHDPSTSRCDIPGCRVAGAAMVGEKSPFTLKILPLAAFLGRSMSAIASLEKSRNSLQTGGRHGGLFMLRCDRIPVMLTCYQQR